MEVMQVLMGLAAVFLSGAAIGLSLANFYFQRDIGRRLDRLSERYGLK